MATTTKPAAAAPTEVRERLTRHQAQDMGLVPRGHSWDEETQQAVPIGSVALAEQLERPMDLQRNLDAFQRNRQTLMKFVGNYLEESQYDSKGYPVPGKLHDYYKVPGSENKALTKLGAEKLAQLFRFGAGTTRLVASQETKEYASATVEVVLCDQYRREVGSAVSSCSTAEPGFRSDRARKKYGAVIQNGKETSPADFRAALNDVVARARKRALVQAIIVATSADEVFVSAEAEPTQEQEVVTATPQNRPQFPAKFGNLGGKYLDEVSSDELVKVADWCRNKAKHPAVYAPLADAITEELERRRLEDDESDDLPF